MKSIFLKTVEDFRQIVETESGRLTKLSASWQRFLLIDSSEQHDLISDDIIGEINVAIGQTELLKRERFVQFKSLLNDFEFKRGEKEITSQDLQGFWDIIYIQVEDILEKFYRLERMRNCGWKADKHTDLLKSPVLKNLSKVTRSLKPPKGRRIAATSDLKAHILAARNKMAVLALTEDSSIKTRTTLQEKSNNICAVKVANGLSETSEKENVSPEINKQSVLSTSSSVDVRNCTNSPETSEIIHENKNNTFDAGFFKIQTPRRPNPCSKATTPASNKLQNSETRVLASSLLRERLLKTPIQHKDYSPCIRITRSMKKRLEAPE